MLMLTWTENALEDLTWWHQHDHKKLKRIIQLCLETCKTPEKGIGKPEPLKFNYQGYWSRRIDERHRLIYAFDDALHIACAEHACADVMLTTDDRLKRFADRNAQLLNIHIANPLTWFQERLL